ncbi:MAG: GIY-YIG nuclease family protein [Aigarchaeota archaeon]|nr:GIY-YIG nuclease family protein [Aigarchaeota archaeon]MDH5703788.1 GIY-YIG nuclease family protein [Aigarchaeota archaeon]
MDQEWPGVREPMAYHVYIILCEDGSYYTGYARNVRSRFNQHLRGTGSRYTRTHKPQKLVYVERFDRRVEAIRRERQVKRLNHSQKLKLVRSSNQKATKIRVSR